MSLIIGLMFAFPPRLPMASCLAGGSWLKSNRTLPEGRDRLVTDQLTQPVADRHSRAFIHHNCRPVSYRPTPDAPQIHPNNTYALTLTSVTHSHSLQLQVLTPSNLYIERLGYELGNIRSISYRGEVGSCCTGIACASAGVRQVQRHNTSDPSLGIASRCRVFANMPGSPTIWVRPIL